LFRFKTRAALGAITAIAALALPASSLATNVTLWDIPQQGHPGANGTFSAPYADAPTQLLDLYRDYNEPLEPKGFPCIRPSPLVYGYDTFGVHLQWDVIPPNDGDEYDDPNNPDNTNCDSPSSVLTSSYQWEFIRPPGRCATHQIYATEPVALYNTAEHKYLAEGGQTWGINLVWTTTPRYQWQVAKGYEPQLPVLSVPEPAEGLADLYNTTEKAYLIDHDRTWGVDLGWIHAPFETGPDYIPPKLPVSIQSVSVTSPLRVK
jgi:hypothetical protein